MKEKIIIIRRILKLTKYIKQEIRVEMYSN
jgi:hypothetical protein